jgi:hypothetical protein
MGRDDTIPALAATVCQGFLNKYIDEGSRFGLALLDALHKAADCCVAVVGGHRCGGDICHFTIRQCLQEVDSHNYCNTEITNINQVFK